VVCSKSTQTSTASAASHALLLAHALLHAAPNPVGKSTELKSGLQTAIIPVTQSQLFLDARIPRLNVRAQPTLYRAAVLLQFLRKRCKRIEHFTHNQ